MRDKLQVKNILIIQDRNKTNETLSEAFKHKIYSKSVMQFWRGNSFVKLLCYPTEPPKYSTRIERDPGTTMTEENRVKSNKK